ncbi:MAG: VOC family protein [Bacteroidales bacterium]
MKQHIAHIALVVADYDEAIRFYTEKLGFQLVEDTQIGSSKRWVTIRPPGGKGVSLLLARAADESQRAVVGNQTGGRVFLFLYTDDFERDFAELVRKGVRIVRQPSLEDYGTVAVFADLYGNLWDLIEPSTA